MTPPAAHTRAGISRTAGVRKHLDYREPPPRVNVSRATARSEAESAHARACANAIHPRLHRRERGLEFEPEPAEHQHARCPRGVGEGEVLADDVLTAVETVPEQVESPP